MFLNWCVFIVTIVFSIDAATKELYELLRVNGRIENRKLPGWLGPIPRSESPVHHQPHPPEGRRSSVSWCKWKAVPICFKLLAQLVRRADSRAIWTAGSNNPTRMPIIAMTTRSSTRVKAFLFILTTTLRDLLLCVLSDLTLWKESQTVPSI